ncbi:DUF2933 domain-containing protein [Aquibacillus salsiterrae]|uniref:DUF2933 domain-containing protein n=1 Tax=Aquibacillus salsiterrae TaxID=2950439 RepID=A0A9X3WEY1_9BACI|nr:DUF2933 domain-containing protein [Aquibacillus salsiterrae]MDC3417015.1 DUF2933 domain-containing protein [Aquibacillus salsiterrae]
MEWGLILLFLLCPLMMLFMHGSHKGKGHNHQGESSKKHDHDTNHNHAIEQDDTTSRVERMDSYKINQLEGQMELLKNQNELLQKKVEEAKRDYK